MHYIAKMARRTRNISNTPLKPSLKQIQFEFKCNNSPVFRLHKGKKSNCIFKNNSSTQNNSPEGTLKKNLELLITSYKPSKRNSSIIYKPPKINLNSKEKFTSSCLNDSIINPLSEKAPLAKAYFMVNSVFQDTPLKIKPRSRPLSANVAQYTHNNKDPTNHKKNYSLHDQFSSIFNRRKS